MRKIRLAYLVKCLYILSFIVCVYKLGQLGFSRLEARRMSIKQFFETVEHRSSDILNRSPTAYQPILPNVQTKRRLTIGIPTIERQNHSYFLDMLGSMFDKTSKEELKEIVFVVFLADINNTIWKSGIEDTLMKKYFNYINNGSLKLIQAPAKFYEEMPIIGQRKKQWQIKQNFDYAYLMTYCEHLSEYYMQMEDDVITVKGYYAAINDFIKQQRNDNWMCLEFSELGFIGKLYHSKHIAELAEQILLQSDTDPVDEIFVPFNIRNGQVKRVTIKPTLFQHMGYHSSLKGKVQPLRDRHFNIDIPLNDVPEKQIKGHNPAAKVLTSMKYLVGFSPKLAYSKERGFFWSSGAPKVDDTLTIVFDSPHVLSRVIINTGSPEAPDDYVHNGVLEASYSRIDENAKPYCLEYVRLGHFKNGSVDLNLNGTNSQIGPFLKTRCLQIRLTKSEKQWLIVREIAVFL